MIKAVPDDNHASNLPAQLPDELIERQMYIDTAARIERALEAFSPSYVHRERLEQTVTRLRRLAPPGPRPAQHPRTDR